MDEKKQHFPDQENDFMIQIEQVKGHTNFSYMGETHGIELKCVVKFKTKINNILMHPDWEESEPTDKLKTIFPDGYYIFEEFKNEKIAFHFIVDYNKNKDEFQLMKVKRKEEPEHYYINSIKKRYTEEALKQFEKRIYTEIVSKYIKKISYD